MGILQSTFYFYFFRISISWNFGSGFLYEDVVSVVGVHSPLCIRCSVRYLNYRPSSLQVIGGDKFQPDTDL